MFHERMDEKDGLVVLAEQKLDQAIKLDLSEPLAAAELYIEAIRLLQQAKRGNRGDFARLNRLESSARERFDDCEKRVRAQQSSMADNSSQPMSDTTSDKGLNKALTVEPLVRQADSHSNSWGLEGALQSIGGWFRRSQGSRSTNAKPHGGVVTADSSQASRPVLSGERAIPKLREPAVAEQRRQTSSAQSQFLKGIDKQLAASILDEILEKSPGIRFNDIAGLAVVKAALQEAIILPSQRPDLFTGIRTPPRGILLFGPPGTGKTLLAKAVATESDHKFLSISAATLTSKWFGQGEKMVKALFAVAAELSPTIVFIDEVDSILGARSEGEHDASRRIKTEFLVQFDGIQSPSSSSRIVVMAATNRPQELDEAVRRRFTKRLYVPLPELATRIQLISRLLEGQHACLSDADLRRVGDLTAGYSGSDIAAICKDAAMAPLRELGARIQAVRAAELRAIRYRDLETAVSRMRPSVSREPVEQLKAWDAEFGSYGGV